MQVLQNSSTIIVYFYGVNVTDIIIRPSKRQFDELRNIHFEIGYAANAEGSCFVKCGNTHILCTASVEEKTPSFLRGKEHGWLTAEYGMLPRATTTRCDREAARGKQTGRTQEIQRLIGRSLRSVLDLKGLGERQVTIDCDVIQADGGTRTAAITGGFLALYQACVNLSREGIIPSMPVRDQIAAISCGIYKNTAILDLDYAEDSNAQADCNFVMTAKGAIVEVQGTAETAPFKAEEFTQLMALAQKGIAILSQKQAEIMTQLLA